MRALALHQRSQTELVRDFRMTYAFSMQDLKQRARPKNLLPRSNHKSLCELIKFQAAVVTNPLRERERKRDQDKAEIQTRQVSKNRCNRSRMCCHIDDESLQFFACQSFLSSVNLIVVFRSITDPSKVAAKPSAPQNIKCQEHHHEFHQAREYC